MATQKVKVVDVSPEQAQLWLAQNTNNRRISKRHLAFLSGVIRRGEWTLSNDAVCFSSDGTLLNGQHRLTAIVESKQTLPLLVMTDTGRDAQLAMDTGKKRLAHEQMEIMGVAGGRSKAALCRAFLAYDPKYGPDGSPEPVSNAEIIELAEGDSLMDTALALSSALGRQIPGARVGMIALGYYLLLNAWPERVDDFHEKLMRGLDLQESSPIYRFRQVLIQGGIRQANHTDRRKLLGMFLKTFNLWIDGRQIDLLHFRINEEWPAPFTPESYQRLLSSRARGVRSHETRQRKAQNDAA